MNIRVECLRIAVMSMQVGSSKEQILERAKTFENWATEPGSAKASDKEQGDAASNARGPSAQAGNGNRR